MHRLVCVALVVVTAGAVAGVPVAYRSAVSVKYRNFRVVEPGVLYRSGQMTPAGFQSVALEYGLRTVVSLRDAKDDAGPLPENDAEADWCRANGVRHIVLSPQVWYAPAGRPPVEPNLRAFLAAVADPAGRPVLVHCFAGIHRTGGYVALYRVDHDGWTADEAVREMKSMGTARTTFDDEIPGYLRAYRRGTLRPPGVGTGPAGG